MKKLLMLIAICSLLLVGCDKTVDEETALEEVDKGKLISSSLDGFHVVISLDIDEYKSNGGVVTKGDYEQYVDINKGIKDNLNQIDIKLIQDYKDYLESQNKDTTEVENTLSCLTLDEELFNLNDKILETLSDGQIDKDEENIIEDINLQFHTILEQVERLGGKMYNS